MLRQNDVNSYKEKKCIPLYIVMVDDELLIDNYIHVSFR